jgi:hypothetical protein
VYPHKRRNPKKRIPSRWVVSRAEKTNDARESEIPIANSDEGGLQDWLATSWFCRLTRFLIAPVEDQGMPKRLQFSHRAKAVLIQNLRIPRNSLCRGVPKHLRDRNR